MPKTCPQCQSGASDDADFCPSCGTALSAASTATQAPPAPNVPPATAAPVGAAPAASAASAVPAYKFDAARWTLADRIAGIATLVLFISLFLPWFTVSSVSRAGPSTGCGTGGCTSP